MWFDCEHLIAEVNDVAEITIEKTRFSTKLPTPAQNVSIRVNVSPEAPSGIYALRLLTEDGMSDVLPLLITSDPITFEQVESHNTAVTAQSVDLPTNLSGKIGGHAELDYYSFEAQKDQELQFWSPGVFYLALACNFPTRSLFSMTHREVGLTATRQFGSKR